MKPISSADNVVYCWLWWYLSENVARKSDRFWVRFYGNILLRPACCTFLLLSYCWVTTHLHCFSDKYECRINRLDSITSVSFRLWIPQRFQNVDSILKMSWMLSSLNAIVNFEYISVGYFGLGICVKGAAATETEAYDTSPSTCCFIDSVSVEMLRSWWPHSIYCNMEASCSQESGYAQ